MGKHAEKLTKVKPFVHKYKWGGIYFPSEKRIGKKLRVILQLLSLFFMLKKKNYILLIFQNITQIVKNKSLFQ